MNNKNNVIDFSERLKQKRDQGGSKLKSKARVISSPSSEEIVDITERRQEIIFQERRLVKRTILTEFIGAFVVVPQKGLMKVTIYDISKDGIAFDIEDEEGGFKVGEEIAMRVYLNQRTYFPFLTSIHNVRKIEDEGVFRHGGAFAKDTMNSEALQHFIAFIETVSASLESDSGDIMVSNLK